jgi:thioredoxin 1
LYGDYKIVQNYGNDDELENILARKRNELMANAQNGSKITSPINLTDSNFNEIVSNHSLLVVDFWAPWCGPCRMVSPIVEQLASELAGKVVFGKLNVDENPKVASMFGIQSIPTIAIFKNGKQVDGFVGAAPKSQIQSRVLGHLGESDIYS